MDKKLRDVFQEIRFKKYFKKKEVDSGISRLRSKQSI